MFTLVFALVGTQVMANGFMIGAQIGTGYTNMNWEYSAFDTDVDYSWTTVNVGLFFDAKYVRLGLDYSTNVGDAQSEGKILGVTGSGDYDATYSFFNISAILKYPIQMNEGTVIWPAAGIEYSINTTVEENGEDVSDTIDDFDDVYIIVGLGADFKISEQIVFTASALFGYNLTPEPAEDTVGDWSIYKFGVNVGIAYAF